MEYIDPRVPAGSDHYFYTECPSRPSIPKLQNQATITAGRDCGLAEWIIDDSCLIIFLFCVIRKYEVRMGKLSENYIINY